MRTCPSRAREVRKGGIRIASMCAAGILAACSGVPVADRAGPSTDHPASAGNPPAPVQTPPPPPAPQVAPAEPPITPPGPQSPAAAQPAPARQIPAPPQPGEQQPHDSGIAVATCVPAEPPKWEVRHKRKATASKESKPAPPATSAAVEPPPGTPVDAQVGELGSEVTSILGKRVQGPKGEDLGRVVDVLADGSGHVRAAIIDFGGFLGVGTRHIAVDWPLLRFDPNARDKNLILSLSREKLQSAPEYKDAKRPQVLMPPAPAPAAAAEATDAKK